ncbi:hypothetical protein CTI14_64140, partial [Methylobacterium radiotolerans]
MLARAQDGTLLVARLLLAAALLPTGIAAASAVERAPLTWSFSGSCKAPVLIPGRPDTPMLARAQDGTLLVARLLLAAALLPTGIA